MYNTHQFSFRLWSEYIELICFLLFRFAFFWVLSFLFKKKWCNLSFITSFNASSDISMQSIEVFLGVRSNLSTISWSYKLLDTSPVLSKKLQTFNKLIMFFISPTTLVLTSDSSSLACQVILLVKGVKKNTFILFSISTHDIVQLILEWVSFIHYKFSLILDYYVLIL